MRRVESGKSSRSYSTTQGITTMTTKTRLGLSVALLSFSLALAPAAFAQDKMGKDDAMKKEDSMSKDAAMKKDGGMMKKDDAMKKDGGAMMKKDDGMKKN